jgi:menaquinone-dependent protoporphyrinogen oxidase
MNVLVACASRHGSTEEIRDRIAKSIQTTGPDIDVVTSSINENGELEPYVNLLNMDAFVIGSAVYFGHWLAGAELFVDTNVFALKAAPIFLFSSGPLDAPSKSEPEESVRTEELMEKTDAYDHMLFAGRLDHRVLGFRERAMAFALHAPEGDFRDMTEVDSWGASIANRLVEVGVPQRPVP